MRPLLAAALLTCVLALPARGQAPPKPILTFQLQPIDRLFAGARQLATRLGQIDEYKKLEAQLTADLGPKGLQGLDLARPITGYQVVAKKPGDLALVVLVPITNKADALDLFRRGKAIYEPTPGDPELYKLTNQTPGDDDIYARFVGTIAYLGANVPLAELGPKKLPTAAALTLPNEGSWLAIVNHLGRVRPEDRQKLIDAFVKFGDKPGRPAVPAEVKTEFDYDQFFRSYAKLYYEQGESGAYRVDFDPKTLAVAFDFRLTPKPGTPLAATIATRKPSTNRFAAVVGKDATAGILMQLPLFDTESRDKFVAALTDSKKVGDKVKDYKLGEEEVLTTEAVKGLGRAARTGQFDLAAALRGPGTDGKYTLAAAVSFGDATKLNAALHKLDPKRRPLLKLDAFEADGVAVHEIVVADAVPPVYKSFFGGEPTAHLALTKTGILATFGRDSLGDIKKLVAAAKTPEPAGVFELRLNAKRLSDLARLAGGGDIAALLPPDPSDETRTVVKLTIDGGETLRLRLVMNSAVAKLPAVLGQDGQ